MFITNSSKCIASVKEHRKLPLEPTYNQPPYPYTTSKSSKSTFPLISPYYHSKSKFLTAIFSNFEHLFITNLSKYIASERASQVTLEPTYNQPSYAYTTSKSTKTTISPHIPLLPLKIQVSNGYIFKF